MKSFLQLLKIVAAIFLMASCGNSIPEKKCVELKTVVKVGGCNEDGLCGVMFADGTFTEAFYGIEGKPICTKFETTEFKWKWVFFQ